MREHQNPVVGVRGFAPFPRRPNSSTPTPTFETFAIAYVMIDEEYFGKGKAKGPPFSFVAMGGPSTLNLQKRQVYMDYQGTTRVVTIFLGSAL